MRQLRRSGLRTSRKQCERRGLGAILALLGSSSRSAVSLAMMLELNPAICDELGDDFHITVDVNQQVLFL